MCDAGHPKPVLRDNLEPCGGREEGGGFRSGETGIPKADSYRCLATTITIL